MNEFDKEIDNIRRELLALKSQYDVSPEVLKTTSQNITLNFDLENHNFGSGLVARSKTMAKVLFDTNGNNPLIGVYFGINNLNNIEIRNVPCYDEDSGRIGRLVYVLDYNSDDINTIKNGGSVSKSYNVKITTSANMDINVKYVNEWVN